MTTVAFFVGCVLLYGAIALLAWRDDPAHKYDWWDPEYDQPYSG